MEFANTKITLIINSFNGDWLRFLLIYNFLGLLKSEGKMHNIFFQQKIKFNY